MEETKRLGDQLIVVIESYANQYGDYPHSLDDLIDKKLLVELPEPTWGAKEWYYVRVAYGFRLNVRKGANDYPMMYSYGYGWGYDDGDF